MRQIELATCSCGGNVLEVEQTSQEEETHNCGKGCCGTALQCQRCGIRFIIKLEAPELEW